MTYCGAPDEVASLRKRCRNWSFWSFDDVVAALEHNHNEMMYVQGEGADWIAVLMYLQALDIADLIYIYVDEAARGSGLGKLMLSEWEEVLLRRNFKELRLEVRTSNAAAIGLYKACGYKEDGVRGGYYSDGESALLMKKSLT